MAEDADSIRRLRMRDGKRAMVVWEQMLRSLLIALAFVSAGALISTRAQDPNEYRIRKIPPPPDLSSVSPFTLNAKDPLVVRMVPAEAMSAGDRALAGSALREIRKRAAAEGFEGNPAQWKQTQLACSAFPQHLLLRFSQGNSAQDASMFSASIPRSSGDHVRLIPILRRGFSLFSPAPTNKITVAIFNRMLAEEHTADKPNASAISLCYAALTGALGSVPDASGVATLQPDHPPVLEIDPGAQASVTLVLGAPDSKSWEMTFDQDGKLVKAARSDATEANSRVAPTTPDPQSGPNVRTVPPPPPPSSVTVPADKNKPQ